MITANVDLDGVTLGYREHGVPEDLPVVLLHALGSSSSTWDKFAPVLAATGRHVIALDLRGHGASSRTPEYSIELMADDVIAFLDARGLPVVDLVGHSMGGAVASLLVGRHPGRVRRLVVEDAPPPPKAPFDDGWPEPPESPPEPVDFDWAVVRPIVSQVRTPDPVLWSRLPAFTGPSLLLKGGPSSHVSQDRIDEMGATLPNARVVLVDVGHRIHSEHPDKFAEVVVPFLTPDSSR